MKKALIVFQKNELLGKVKSRLAATIGDASALDCYSKMIKYTYDQIQFVDVEKYIFFSESSENQVVNDWKVYTQHGNDLGSRMFNAFKILKDRNYDKVIIIGTDCLELTHKIIDKAFNVLDSNDFVIGPANDGGYYLLGLNNLDQKLFINKQWSTDSVFDATLKDIQDQHKSVYILDRLNDIDDFDDLMNYQNKTGNILL